MNLSHNTLSERSIKPILYTLYFCPNIRELYLSGNVIRSTGLKVMAQVLSKNTSTPITRYAKSLNMDRFSFTNKLINSMLYIFIYIIIEIEELNPSKPFPLCLHITTLDLSSIYLTEDGMKYLGQLLSESLMFLELLNLESNQLNPDSFYFLGENMKCSSSVKVINLNNNYLYSKGLMDFVQLIQKKFFPYLEEIYIESIFYYLLFIN